MSQPTRLLLGAASLMVIALLVVPKDQSARSGPAIEIPPDKIELFQLDAQRREANANRVLQPLDFDNLPDWFVPDEASDDDLPPPGSAYLLDYPSLQGDEYDHSRYSLVNSWRWHPDDATVVTIDAGSLKEVPSRGLVIVVVRQARSYSGKADVRNGVHLTPTQTGALEITGADGHMVKLLSTTGVEWIFDAGQGRFVSPVEEPLPTATPSPRSVPTPVILPVQRISIDADPSGNSATAWGGIDACATSSIGGRVNVDLILDGLPLVGGSPMGVIGYDLDLAYDSRVLRVVDVDVDMLLSVKPNSYVTSVGDSIPDSDGTLGLTVGDFGPTGGDMASISETTGGVLARITFEAIGAGASALTIAQAFVIDTKNDAHPVANLPPGEIAVAQTC